MKFTCELIGIVLKKPIKHWGKIGKMENLLFSLISSKQSFNEEILDSVRQIFIDAEKIVLQRRR